MSELPKNFEICLWCTKPMEEGLIHLPTDQKGKCSIIGGTVKRSTARHPVGLLASGDQYDLKERIQKIISIEIKKKFGKDLTASNFVVNWQMSIMNFCANLLEDTQRKILTGAHMAYMEEMEGKEY